MDHVAGPLELAAPAPPRAGALARAGRALLLVAIAGSLVWFPIARTGAGTIAGSDAALIFLWALTILDLLVRGSSDVDVDSASIAVLAIFIALLAAFGSALTRSSATGPFEFMLFMKRFGLAAIIPLAAARFGSPSMGRSLRVLTALAMATFVVFALRPELHDLLPKPDDWQEGIGRDRAMGIGMNPNNLAYAAIALAVLHGALLPRRAGGLGELALGAVLAGAGFCVVVSGSRSGLVGGVVALGYLIARSPMGAKAKLAVSAGTVAVLVVGLSVSPVFQERLGRLYREGMGEANVQGRMHAQWLAARASLEHPLGVGYRNIQWASRSTDTYYAFATTDSVYLDTLLGAGVPGLLALVLLFRACWRRISRAREHPRVEITLRAGFVAFLTFGAATVVPMSIFLAPLFYAVVSGGSCAGDARDG
jgi:O-antigen ligase